MSNRLLFWHGNDHANAIWVHEYFLKKLDYLVAIDSIPDEMSVVVMRSNGDAVFKGSTPATVTLAPHELQNQEECSELINRAVP